MLYRHWDNDSRSLRLTKGLGKTHFRVFQWFRRRLRRNSCLRSGITVRAVAWQNRSMSGTQFVIFAAFEFSVVDGIVRIDDAIAKAATDGQGRWRSPTAKMFGACAFIWRRAARYQRSSV